MMACTPQGIGEVAYCREYPLPLGPKGGACTPSPTWTTLPAVEVVVVVVARGATDLMLMLALLVTEAPGPVRTAVPGSLGAPDLPATAIALAAVPGPQGTAIGTTINATSFDSRTLGMWFPSIERP